MCSYAVFTTPYFKKSSRDKYLNRSLTLKCQVREPPSMPIINLFEFYFEINIISWMFGMKLTLDVWGNQRGQQQWWVRKRKSTLKWKIYAVRGSCEWLTEMHPLSTFCPPDKCYMTMHNAFLICPQPVTHLFHVIALHRGISYTSHT